MEKSECHLAAFDYQAVSSGKVLLFWKSRLIKTLAGTEAARFLDKINRADSKTTQLLIAKATGNFKRGNERSSPIDG
jgi:hypothetical protein